VVAVVPGETQQGAHEKPGEKMDEKLCTTCHRLTTPALRATPPEENSEDRNRSFLARSA